MGDLAAQVILPKKVLDAELEIVVSQTMLEQWWLWRFETRSQGEGRWKSLGLVTQVGLFTFTERQQWRNNTG